MMVGKRTADRIGKMLKLRRTNLAVELNLMLPGDFLEPLHIAKKCHG